MALGLQHSSLAPASRGDGVRLQEVNSCDDEAVGVVTKNERAVPWVSAVTLHPKIAYSGDKLPCGWQEPHQGRKVLIWSVKATSLWGHV